MYQRCPKKYEYSRVQNLEKIGIQVPQDKGSWVHTLLMEDFLGNDWRAIHAELIEIWEQEVVPFTMDEDALAVPDEALRMFEAYKTKYPDDSEHWKVLQVEESMSFELIPGVQIGFTPDLVAEDSGGNIWAWDHKTTQTLPQLGEMLIDTQSLIYSVGLRLKYGERFRGFIFNYIRSKPPTVPKLRKDGLIADVRRVDTTYDVLLHFAAENGVRPYDELTEKLAYLSDHDAFFRRDLYMVTDDALVNATQDLISWVSKMEADRELEGMGLPASSYGRTILHRSAGVQSCHNCGFFSLCQAELLGMESESIRLNDYQERTPLGREYLAIGSENGKHR